MKNNLRSASQQPEPMKSSVLSVDVYVKTISLWSLNTRAKVDLELSPCKTLFCESTFREKRTTSCQGPQGTAIERLPVVSIQVYSVEF